MKRMFVTLLAVAFLAAGATLAIAADKGPEEVKLPAKMGEVTFPHFAHQDLVEDCTTCHHQGVEAGACTDCHGVMDEAPSAKDAFHDQCKGCHQEQGGPTGCRDCHQK